jgi:hypothetical protein
MATNVHAQTSAIPKILHSGLLTATASTTIATVPALSTWTIKSACVCNTTGSVATLTLDVVPLGQTSAAARRVINAMSIGVGDTLDLSWLLEGVQMSAGDFIAAWSGTASALSLTITGIEAV